MTPEVGRAARYVLVGFSNTAISLGVYAGLIEIGVFYILAGVIGCVLGLLNGYFWNRTWTFRAGPHQHELLIKYATVGISCLVLNSALLALMVDVIGAGKFIAQLIVLPLIALTSFTTNRFWTFGRHLDLSHEPATAPACSSPSEPARVRV